MEQTHKRANLDRVAQRLPRFYLAQQRIEDERKLAKIILEAGDDEPVKVCGSTSPMQAACRASGAKPGW